MAMSTRKPPRTHVPSSRNAFSTRGGRRMLAGAALAAAVLALLFLVLTGGASHKYGVVFQNAGQLVPGDLVRIGGGPPGGGGGPGPTPHRPATAGNPAGQ